MKNEFEYIKEYYCTGNYKAYSFNDDKLISKIEKNSIPHERPDIVSIVDNTIYGIEHFEYDAYEKRKGSKYKEEEFLVRNRLRKEAMKYPNQTLHNYSDIKVNGNTHMYIDNFNNVLMNHYQKIDEYKERLNKEYNNSNIKILFLAEDTNPIGTATQTNGGLHILLPYMFERSLSLIESLDELDGILFTYYDIANRGIFILTKKDYETVRKKYMFNENDCDIETLSPQNSMFAHYIKINN